MIGGKMNKPFVIDIDEKCRVTYIDQKNNTSWPEWKFLKDCNEKEIEKVNLATPHDKYIVLDRDFKKDVVVDDEMIEREYNIIKNKLEFHAIDNWIADKSRNEFHIFIPTSNLDKVKDPEVRKEIRNIFIDEFKCDRAKNSSNTVIALPNKPHFKTGITYGLLEVKEGDIYKVKDTLIRTATERVKNRTEILKKLEKDADFENYFEKDPFFKYIKNNIIPDNTSRDINIFPNLAIACVKAGKEKEEIDKLIKPIIEKNFPGKRYAEFEGWLKKAYQGKITSYNFYQLNNWMKEYSIHKKEIYDMEVPLQEDLKTELEDRKENVEQDETGEQFELFWDKDLHKIQSKKIEWLVEGWLAKSDICVFAGKSSSFKSTLSMHMAYCIAEGKLFLNKYKTKKCKVMYINEENSVPVMLNMIRRVKKGLDLEDHNSGNLVVGILQNFRLDNIAHLTFLMNFIKRNNIEVFIYDTFRRGFSFDENNATEMNRIFNNLKIFRKECNDCTIILLNHLKKQNTQFFSDIRDMIRGTSEIVNNADSILGVQRKAGSMLMHLEQIKNRSGIEMEKKLVIMDTGEDKDKSYFYESDKELNSVGHISAPEKCAEEINKWVEDKEIKEFKRKDIDNIIGEKYSSDVIAKALRALTTDGIVDRLGGGKGSKYFVCELVKKTRKGARK
jgi:archaellum biogenesis ATPase FlaH